MAENDLSIGVDMGGTSIKFAVVRGTELIGRAEPVRTQDFVSPDAIFAEVGKRLKELIAEYPEVKLWVWVFPVLWIMTAVLPTP